MPANVPSGAAKLLDFIGKAETARDGLAAYRTIIGHREDQIPKPIIDMTVDELIAAQLGWGKRWKSSAAGKYQIIRKTLVGLKAALKLTGKEKFTPELQDRLALELLRQRGFDKAVDGKLGQDAFALAIAKEWASMPVLKAVQGASRKVARGQSFYAGDGLNKSLVSADEFEAVLSAVLKPRASQVPTAGFPEKGARDNEVVAQVQRRLKELGYTEIGNVDGDFGDMTEKAIIIFKIDNQLPASGAIDAGLLVAMAKAKPREISVKRAEATPEAVREQVPEARDSWWSKVVAFWGMIGAGAASVVNFTISNLKDAREAVKPLTDILGTVPLWAWGLLFGGGLLTIWLKSRASVAKSVAAYQEGARR